MKQAPWNLLPDLVPCIADYALGHKLVSAANTDCKRVYECHTMHEVASFDLVSQTLANKEITFTISDWRWLSIRNEPVHGVSRFALHGSWLTLEKSSLHTNGTMLLCQVTKECTWQTKPYYCRMLDTPWCLVGLAESDTLRVGRFLMRHGTPEVRQSLCTVYREPV